jgi:hypothetical protein
MAIMAYVPPELRPFKSADKNSISLFPFYDKFAGMGNHASKQKML